jgi:hypothetical protein
VSLCFPVCSFGFTLIFPCSPLVSFVSICFPLPFLFLLTSL